MGLRGPQPRPIAERFWEKVAVVDGDGCWLWTAGTDKRGYGQFGVGDSSKSKTVRAHRFAYEDKIGPIPEGLTLDHLCFNRACVRPSHLEPVTTQVNTRRWADTITHCHRGHEYTPENTYLNRGKWRQCKTCSARRNKEFYEARART